VFLCNETQENALSATIALARLSSPESAGYRAHFIDTCTDFEATAMSNFWEILYLVASSFLFFAYLIILFHIVVDLFRDPSLGGGYKALWLIGLLFLPFLTALLYVLVRGKGMGTRQRSALERARSDTEAYIREVARTSPAEQIAAAKALLDAGTINQDDFGRLKEKALA
jgi:hypothetical protein